MKDLLHMSPTDLGILREMAQLYVESGDVNSAITIFRRVLNEKDSQKFLTFTHLNIFIDLLHIAEEYESAVDAIFEFGFVICRNEKPLFNFMDEMAVIKDLYPIQLIGKLIVSFGKCGKVDEAKVKIVYYQA